MRRNEYNSIDEFTSQYIGIWNPSEGHWLGLDFSYKGSEYRMQTEPMYTEQDTILPNGETAVFYLYKKAPLMEGKLSKEKKTYELIGEYASMEALLMSRMINGELFKSVIMDDATELLGQD